MAGKIYIVSKQRPISKESRTEWNNEKRAKELTRRGYDVGQISAMMDSPRDKISTRQVEKWVKHKVRDHRDMVIDGRL